MFMFCADCLGFSSGEVSNTAARVGSPLIDVEAVSDEDVDTADSSAVGQSGQSLQTVRVVTVSHKL